MVCYPITILIVNKFTCPFLVVYLYYFEDDSVIVLVFRCGYHEQYFYLSFQASTLNPKSSIFQAFAVVS